MLVMTTLIISVHSKSAKGSLELNQTLFGAPDLTTASFYRLPPRLSAIVSKRMRQC